MVCRMLMHRIQHDTYTFTKCVGMCCPSVIIKEDADAARKEDADAARKEGADAARKEGADAARKEDADASRKEDADAARKEDVSHSCPRNVLICVGDDDSTVVLYCIACARVMHVFATNMHPLGKKTFGACTALALKEAEPGAFSILAGYENGSIIIWNTSYPNGCVNDNHFHIQKSPILSIALHPNLPFGVAGSAEGVDLCIFEYALETNALEVKKKAALSKPGIEYIVSRDDGKVFAACCWDGKVRLFKWSSGKQVKVLRYHKHATTCCWFYTHLDTPSMAVCSRDRTISIWDMTQQKICC